MSETDKKLIRETINKLTSTLGETDKKPQRQIANIVKLCGVEFAEQILEETLKVEADGGMMINKGSRRRTIGGVFFHLAKENMQEDTRQQIFYAWRAQARRHEEREAQYPEFDYNNERAAVVTELQAHTGKVTDVKVNLIGRPEAIDRRRDLVILTMRDHISEETVLPNGVPQPDPRPVDYSVYISAKQWERLDKVLEDETDDLVIEGHMGYDAETDTMAIYATYVTSQKLQRKKKKQDKQQRKTGEGTAKSNQKSSKPARRNDKPQRNQREHRPPPTPADFEPVSSEPQETQAELEIDIQLPDGVPNDVAEKLMGLYKAAATFRQKIAALEAKPADEQFGLEMTQKLLTNTEAQIEKLEESYKGK